MTQEVQHERMTAARVPGQPERPVRPVPAPDPPDRPGDRRLHRAALAALGDVPTTVARPAARRSTSSSSTLETTRQQVLTRSDLTVSAVVLRYGAMAEDLVAYRESLGQIAGDTALGDTLRAAAALSRTKLQVGAGAGRRVRGAADRHDRRRAAHLVPEHADRPAGVARRLHAGGDARSSGRSSAAPSPVTRSAWPTPPPTT